MNSYIQKMKEAITNYLGSVQATQKKIEEGYGLYLPEAAQKEEERLLGEQAKKRKAAEDAIEAAYNEGSKPARNWGRLDGSKITEDARLLDGPGVTPKQFDELVERYSDNYTMLDRLRGYGEARNAEAVKSGNGSVTFGPYNVASIPDPNSRVEVWNLARAQAHGFLDIADGTGIYSDPFTRSFARATADKELEAFGADIN